MQECVLHFQWDPAGAALLAGAAALALVAGLALALDDVLEEESLDFEALLVSSASFVAVAVRATSSRSQRST